LQDAPATPEALLARDATPYGVVHFDTHAFALREEPPPSLLLHPSRNAPYGLLTMSDVARMKLRARVVVLSACESALGPGDDPVPGEGIEALARAFLLAGARSVIATLWVVRVPPAAATVESFYREMGANPDSDLAAALHRAKRNTRARFSLRDDWTGFILIGDPGR